MSEMCRNCGHPIIRPAHGRHVPYQHKEPGSCPTAVPAPYPDEAVQAEAAEFRSR